MNRKDIFISGFKSKIGYSFTYKDLTEFETVINFYEQQCEKQREVINKLELENKVLKEQMVAMVKPNYTYGIR